MCSDDHGSSAASDQDLPRRNSRWGLARHHLRISVTDRGHGTPTISPAHALSFADTLRQPPAIIFFDCQSALEQRRRASGRCRPSAWTPTASPVTSLRAGKRRGAVQDSAPSFFEPGEMAEMAGKDNRGPYGIARESKRGEKRREGFYLDGASKSKENLPFSCSLVPSVRRHGPREWKLCCRVVCLFYNQHKLEKQDPKKKQNQMNGIGTQVGVV
ncbi:MAG: hypothetical protein JKX97_09130 [Candidatus Lindowbacteria bacterium]|nr:hypothetical protein [Candidatus Lindowbacteria bacterium]